VAGLSREAARSEEAMAKRPGPGPDDLDADLFASPDEIAAALAEPATPPLGDSLDLHHFAPRECGDVVAEYLDAARAAGLRHVRIIHGKGTGALRRSVHAVLARHPAVRSYQLADERSGSWGATWVELRDA
jgi:dsDNA-specific endonuclease/ATPase MutS2